jgi:hypothetical protein
MQERLGHRRLVCALNPTWSQVGRFLQKTCETGRTIKPKISGLECHLHKCVRAEAVRRDKRLSITAELDHSTIVLADQVTEPSFSKTNANAQLWRALKNPFKLLWGDVRRVQ